MQQQQQQQLQQRVSTATLSAEIPFSNTFNTHCNICCHPVSQPDINVLQPCFCGPFHGYCITNLELQTRDQQPNNSELHLTCPTCAHPVTAVSYDFISDLPHASRPPFTTKPQTLLPAAIHDTNPKYSNPTMSHAPQPWSPHSVRPRPNPMPPPPVHQPQPSPYHPPQDQFTPTAPPRSYDHIQLPFDLDDNFPPPPPHYQPNFSNFAPESSPPPSNKPIHLPSPYDGPPCSSPDLKYKGLSHERHPHHSPNTIVICKHVDEEAVRGGLYGEDVYKAYVEGKARVLAASPDSNKYSHPDQQLNVKIDMDLHLFHHYTPGIAPTPHVHVRRTHGEKNRKKTKSTEKTWWKAPRNASRTDSTVRHRNDERHRGRGVSSRRS